MDFNKSKRLKTYKGMLNILEQERGIKLDSYGFCILLNKTNKELSHKFIMGNLRELMKYKPTIHFCSNVWWFNPTDYLTRKRILKEIIKDLESQRINMQRKFRILIIIISAIIIILNIFYNQNLASSIPLGLVFGGLLGFNLREIL